MHYVLATINCRSLTFLLVRKTNTVFLDVLIIALYIAVKSERRTLERINISYMKLRVQARFYCDERGSSERPRIFVRASVIFFWNSVPRCVYISICIIVNINILG